MSADPAVTSLPAAERARRRIARRLLPYLFVLYVVAYLDRVNVGYAALDMTSDLSFTPSQYGFGVGIFFAGYVLLEIPGTILVERWSARKWIARIMVSWGLVAACAGFVHSAHQFYWVRFLLGAAEAGFFPGIIVYLSHWFRYQDRARAMATFVAAQPIANIFGSPVSGLLLNAHWLGLAGWRWLFIIEGVPAIVLGVVTFFFLTDWPDQASWLPGDERAWITAELARERAVKDTARSFTAWQALAHPQVLLLCISFFCVVTSVYGFNFWLPTILKGMTGASNLRVTLLSAVPYCVGLAAMLVVSWSSDRSGERRWHTAACMLAISLGLALSALWQSAVVPAMFMFCLAAAGMFAYVPTFWALPTRFLGGTAAAAAIGLINSLGNLG